MLKIISWIYGEKMVAWFMSAMMKIITLSLVMDQCLWFHHALIEKDYIWYL